MPGYNVVSGAEAFSDSIDKQLLQQAAAKRQAMLDSLHAKAEADQAKYREQEIELRHQELADRMESRRDAKLEKEKAGFEKDVLGNMVKGDILDQATVDKGLALGIPAQRLVAPGSAHPAVAGQMGQVAQPVTLPGAGSLEGTPSGLDAPQMQAPAIPAVAPQAASAGVFVGNVKERQAELDRARQQAFIDSMPDDDPRKQELALAFKAEQTGLKVPPGYFAKPQATKTRFQFDPVTGKYFDATGKQVSDLPPDAVVDRRAEPKDHSAGDAARAATADRHLDTVHQAAVTELNKRALPYESHLQSINDLGIMLNARTPQADALIAPMILKATVSGAGTGFRMTQSEINQVVGGRSKWESLEAALNKWNQDPSKALSITDEQRTQMRGLAKKIREKASSMTRKVADTRHKLDDATTPQEIHKLMTGLQDDLGKMELESEDVQSEGTTIEYDMNGKPIKSGKK